MLALSPPVLGHIHRERLAARSGNFGQKASIEEELKADFRDALEYTQLRTMYKAWVTSGRLECTTTQVKAAALPCDVARAVLVLLKNASSALEGQGCLFDEKVHLDPERETRALTGGPDATQSLRWACKNCDNRLLARRRLAGKNLQW
jgi:hypothetical protein